ncbi:hypothetical protein AKJ40_00700 [candidate division MSBL1 archaeon SCGC-AAA259M10]|uniref:Uncharacterized protein n=1 Tax=candidate division MSBL1 archaeon SCGC-AAA259M10 TaxID=1698270 RepID=A0A133V2Q8_9EURY|nr:hypothetical protein AKJ40_00700 [candidate division MSBL1 archaeon SCGC-AAA259M10]
MTRTYPVCLSETLVRNRGTGLSRILARNSTADPMKGMTYIRDKGLNDIMARNSAMGPKSSLARTQITALSYSMARILNVVLKCIVARNLPDGSH